MKLKVISENTFGHPSIKILLLGNCYGHIGNINPAPFSVVF